MSVSADASGHRIYKSPHGTRPVKHQGIFHFVWSNWEAAKDSKVALIDGPTGEKLTRAELRDASQRLAYGVRNKAGVEPGQVALTFSPNSIYYYVLLLACQCAGVVVSPANAAYSSQELAHQLKESGASIIFVHPALLETARKGAEQAGWSQDQLKSRIFAALPKKHAGNVAVASYEDLMGKDALTPHRIKNPRDTVAYLCFSSGTTSAAKGVMTTHSNMCAVLSILDVFGPKAGDVILATLPLSHIYGLTKLLHWPILLGMTTVVMPKFELKMFLELVPRYKVSMGYLVPPVILLLAREKIVDDYDLSSLRFIVSGAAPLGAALEQEVEKRLKIPVRQAYGLTETSPTTHLCPMNKARPGSIGVLLPNVDGRLVNPETLKDVEEGKEGEIWLKGMSIMKGYLNRPEATAETLVEGGWLRTGDVGYVKDDHWYISDRAKELIKYKGFQVPPAELESVLISHPEVKDAACLGVYSEEDATELPRAFVVPTEPEKAKSDAKGFEKSIQDYVAGKVAGHKRLRGGVIIVDEIPKSPSGKILRRMLKEKYGKEVDSNVKAKL